MLIRIDSSSGVAIWQQIVQQVTRQAMSGSIGPGERLPTVREMASDLRINPNTAARAYQELERDAIVETRRGAGTFLCDVTHGKTSAEFQRIVEQRLDEVLVEALHVGFAREEIGALFQARLEVLAKLHERPARLPAAATAAEERTN